MDEDVYTDDFEPRSSNNVVDAIEAVESAVARVEAAVKEKWSSAVIVGWMFIEAIFWDVPGNMWHSKLRYEVEHSVNADQVIADTRPHDCAFLAAPLGEKYCHYKREVTTWHRGTSSTGNPLISYDNGKTWTVVENTDPSIKWPKYDTVVAVNISWKKVEE
jgi:hypothetical protein